MKEEMASMPPTECLVIIGVDSHKELHVAVAVDQLGRRLGACTVATTPRGFGQLVGPLAATKLALRELARRHQALSAELARLDHQIAKLTATTAPRLLARGGVGPQVATALLIAAGDNPARLRSDAAFAMLCGAAPNPASSGKVIRHRLNRGGDRQATTPCGPSRSAG
jgi:transposase